MNTLQDVDTLIYGGTIVTMDPDRRVIKDGTILIKGDSIVKVDASNKISNEITAKKVISAKGKVLLPGLINAHSHLAMTIFRGFAEDLSLQDWLEKLWEYEFSPALNAKAIRIGSKLAFVEMIKGGITCAHNMYFYFDETMKLAEKIGFRLLSGPPITRLGGQEFEQMLDKAQETLAWLKELGYVYPVLQAHSTYTTTPKIMHTVRDLKEEHGIPFTMHASEDRSEVEAIQEQYQKRPVALLDSYDLLDERTILAHCVNLNEHEIDLLAETGTNVAHCPESNLKIGEGIAPVVAMLEKGVNVCIGTDGAASNNDLDLIGEMRTAALLQKGSNQNPELLTSNQTLAMATINGAKAYHMESLIGSLESGKKADVVIVDFNRPHLTPVHDPATSLIYSASKSDVDTVIIDGKVQLENGKLTMLDQDEAMAEIRTLVAEFFN